MEGCNSEWDEVASRVRRLGGDRLVLQSLRLQMRDEVRIPLVLRLDTFGTNLC
jgi:hypothetical protein